MIKTFMSYLLVYKVFWYGMDTGCDLLANHTYQMALKIQHNTIRTNPVVFASVKIRVAFMDGQQNGKGYTYTT